MIVRPARPSEPQHKPSSTASAILSALIFVFGISSAFSSDVLGPETVKKSGTKQPSEAVQVVSTNWGVNCQPQANSKKLTCVLSQSILMAKTRQVFVSVSIQPTPAKTAPGPYMATVRLPHGLALASGIQFQIDKQKPGRLTLFTSSPQGMFARVAVINRLLALLKKGKHLKITFRGINGRKFAMSMSLKGFMAGFEKLK